MKKLCEQKGEKKRSLRADGWRRRTRPVGRLGRGSDHGADDVNVLCGSGDVSAVVNDVNIL